MKCCRCKLENLCFERHVVKGFVSVRRKEQVKTTVSAAVTVRFAAFQLAHFELSNEVQVESVYNIFVDETVAQQWPTLGRRSPTKRIVRALFVVDRLPRIDFFEQQAR